jgi:hypothetical protein
MLPDGRPTGGRALVKNAADKGQVRAARKAARANAQQVAKDWVAVMETPEGKRIAWRLIGICRTFQTVYDMDSHRTAYFAGKQDVGHQLLAEIMAAHPKAFLQMMQDQYDTTLPETEPDTTDDDSTSDD